MEKTFKSYTPITFKVRYVQQDGLHEINLKKCRRASFVLHNQDTSAEVSLTDFGYDNLGEYEGSMWFRIKQGLAQGTYNLVGYAITYEWNKVDVGSVEPIVLVVGDDQTAVYQDFGQISCRITANEEPAHNGPYIQDGYWYVWNAENNQYVNSGVKATPDIPSEYLSAVTVNGTKLEGYNHNVNLGNVTKRVKLNGVEHSADNSGLVDLGYIRGGGGGTTIYPFGKLKDLDEMPDGAIARYEGLSETFVFEGRNYGYGTCLSKDENDDWYAMSSDGMQYTNSRQIGQYTGDTVEYERLCMVNYGVSMSITISEEINGVEVMDTLMFGSFLQPKLFSHNLNDFAVETASYGRNYLCVKKTKQNHPRKNLKWRVETFMSQTHDYLELEWIDGTATGTMYPCSCMADTVTAVANIQEQLSGVKFDYIFKNGQTYTSPVSYNLGNISRTSIRMSIEPTAVMGANISFSGVFDQSAALTVVIDNQQNTSNTVTIGSLTELTDGTVYTCNAEIQIAAEKETIATFFFNGSEWTLDSQTSQDRPTSVADNVRLYTLNSNQQIVNMDGSPITESKDYVMSHYVVFIIYGQYTYMHMYHDALAPNYCHTFVCFKADQPSGKIYEYKTIITDDGPSWAMPVTITTNTFPSGGGGSNMVYDASTGNLTGAKDASGNDVTLSTTNITITF